MLPGFAINPDNLLGLRHDAGLETGAAWLATVPPTTDLLGAQEFPQILGGSVADSRTIRLSRPSP